MSTVKFLSLVLSLAMLAGCSALNRQFKASPAPLSPFLEHREELTEWSERVPMQKIWMHDREAFYRERARFTKISIRPVLTHFVNQHRSSWVASDEAVERMADFIRTTFEEAFENDPRHRFEVTDTPDADTVVYRIALTELVPTKVGINVAGTVLGAVVPGGGLVKAVAKGSIAIEAQVVDGASGAVLAEWADRESDKITLVSLAEFSPYSFSRDAVRDWADQLVTLYNTPMNVRVPDSLVVTLALY